MKFYYSGKQPDAYGVIRVHAETCKSLPDILGRIYIGMFPNGNLAMETAKNELQLAKVKVCKCCT
ncbi:hypothetical protein [Christiangramia sp. SM2212]|uniref:Uncharacterized protein n=1 Tax=Christiangramia sediminicola TaxID=3073267 RepID=A0ABU1EM62_9FLAO|nr:hypothetical protein [Christiangramia sp. SM2212]MDR5589452.1 hypothetical protein [Christiangramia sp. SM2212]